MTPEDAHRAIYQRWMTLWPGLSGAVPFVFDNDVADESMPYARVSVQRLASEQHTMGGAPNRKFDRSGLIWVKLSAPANQGSKAVDRLLQHVRTVFEAVRFGNTGGLEDGVVTFATSDETPVADGRLWILVATTPFEYTETR